MARVVTSGKMEGPTTETMTMIRNTALEFTDGPMEEFMLETGFKVSKTRPEFIFCQMVISRRQNGLVIRKDHTLNKMKKRRIATELRKN